THRLRPLLEPSELPSPQNQLLTVLSRASGDTTLRRHARLAHRMPTAVASPFTTTQRMVDRVHRLRPRVRPISHMPLPAGLPDTHVDPVEISQLPNRRPARAANPAHLTRRQNDHRPLPFFRTQPCHSTGRSHQLP